MWTLFQLMFASTKSRAALPISAAAALRAHVTERMKLPSLVSYIDRENAASIRLAERLGARLDPDAARPEGDDCLVYRHPLGEAA